jgi:hypothetical protein
MVRAAAQVSPLKVRAVKLKAVFSALERSVFFLTQFSASRLTIDTDVTARVTF